MTLTRRNFLQNSLAKGGVLGCSLAASPLVTPMSFASAPWDTRLVVIILRGGMDGLDVVRPIGDPGFAGLRMGFGQKTPPPGHDLDGFYAMHPGLGGLLPLWRRGQLGFVHAVSTPYRNKRSHFDGQDLLEAGTLGLGDARDGWLNRLLQGLPGIDGRTAFAIGQGEMKLLSGSAPFSSWRPEAALQISPQAERLAEFLMEDDPMFEAAFAEATALSQMTADPFVGEEDGDTGMMAAPASGRGQNAIAAFAAERLRAETRIAAFSINGWDTHARQARALDRGLKSLSEVILTLEAGLGPEIWGKTAVVAMTEFGRTVRENGTLGTDHGTGGAMLLAGGAIRGGRVFGRWPGLAEADLYERRDLMPTGDVRAATAWIMHGLMPLGRDALEGRVFPGVDMGDNPGLLL